MDWLRPPCEPRGAPTLNRPGNCSSERIASSRLASHRAAADSERSRSQAKASSISAQAGCSTTTLTSRRLGGAKLLPQVLEHGLGRNTIAAGHGLQPAPDAFHGLGAFCQLHEPLVRLGVLDNEAGGSVHGEDYRASGLFERGGELWGVAFEVREGPDVFGKVEHGEFRCIQLDSN